MHIEPPTRREIWLAVFLLITLLFVSRSRPTFELPSSASTGSQHDLATHDSASHGTELAPQSPRGRIRWGSGEVPQTKLVAHVPGTSDRHLLWRDSCAYQPDTGWTIFDKIYLLNGTLYVVTDDPSKLPDRSLIISTGISIMNGKVEEAKRLPTDKEMQIINPKQAKALFGPDAAIIDGVSVSSAHSYC